MFQLTDFGNHIVVLIELPSSNMNTIQVVFLIVLQLVSIISSENMTDNYDQEPLIELEKTFIKSCNHFNETSEMKLCKNDLWSNCRKYFSFWYGDTLFYTMCNLIEVIENNQEHYCLSLLNVYECNKTIVESAKIELENRRKCIEKAYDDNYHQAQMKEVEKLIDNSCILINNIMDDKTCKNKLSQCVKVLDYNLSWFCVYYGFRNIFLDQYCLNVNNTFYCNKIIENCQHSEKLGSIEFENNFHDGVIECIENDLAESMTLISQAVEYDNSTLPYQARLNHMIDWHCSNMSNKISCQEYLSYSLENKNNSNWFYNGTSLFNFLEGNRDVFRSFNYFLGDLYCPDLNWPECHESFTKCLYGQVKFSIKCIEDEIMKNNIV